MNPTQQKKNKKRQKQKTTKKTDVYYVFVKQKGITFPTEAWFMCVMRIRELHKPQSLA